VHAVQHAVEKLFFGRLCERSEAISSLKTIWKTEITTPQKNSSQ
jgi:hypothetical protein